MMQSFAADMPAETHLRRATCDEVDCLQYLQGWVTVVPTMSALAEWIRTSPDWRPGPAWRYREETGEGGMSTFTFEAGQECFLGAAGEHRTPVGRPVLYTHDGRAIPRAEDWVGDFREELHKIEALRQRG